ncbi:hypothetical protein ILUMI_06365 [Ignelater luminosus]|uniref:Glutamyl-tRNA(Gln) amidotransferase subunit B, mitochondrial n=1 Tax=Ignelater luminosus TaxID=2038154 RepID=A0A8K0GFF9_IGNLU|nr:hypothetical protein ILUMI_06365 [Ignelater luminosus]
MFMRRFITYLNTRRKYSKKSIKNKWKSVVGLEVHAQIYSNSKLFSGSSTDFASPVNANVSLFDSAIPGTLPVLNKRCVEAGVLTALALNCRINPVSMFDRKHYFYADLPAGYQITQQRTPLANEGILEFQVYIPGIHKTAYTTRSHIKQIQLEQDSGKSLHEEERSLVDLNRAGVPLMELVFEPDLVDGEEAAALIKELVLILEKLKTCSCKMEEGALRVDANVSVHQPGEPLGTRTEIKNIGSIRGVAGAVNYEIQRQIKLLEKGEIVVNETRAWDAVNKITVAMRDKEEKQDYRYMPEPNLPPLHIAMGSVKWGCVNADDLKATLPELPYQTRSRLKDDYGLTMEQSIILVNEAKLLTAFSETMNKNVDPKLVANILINDFLTLIHKNKMSLDIVQVDGKYFSEIVGLLQNETINRLTARLLLSEMLYGASESPSKIVAARGWAQIADDEELKALCKNIIEINPKIVKQYRDGKVKVFAALLGQIAKESNQRANMSKVPKILKELLEK